MGLDAVRAFFRFFPQQSISDESESAARADGTPTLPLISELTVNIY